MTLISQEQTDLAVINSVVEEAVMNMRHDLQKIVEPCIVVLWDDDEEASKAAELLSIPRLDQGYRAVVTAHPTLSTMAAPLSKAPPIHRAIVADHISGCVRVVAIGLGRSVVWDLPLLWVLSRLN